MERYFADCKTIDEAKSRHRELCKEHHPDHGGDAERFKEMQAQFEAFLKGYRYYSDRTGKQSKEREQHINNTMRDVIRQIIHMEECTIEIIGSWIWITGATWLYKDELKALHFWFSGKKKAWYWNGSDRKRKVRGMFTLDQVREMWGTQELQTQKRNRPREIRQYAESAQETLF